MRNDVCTACLGICSWKGRTERGAGFKHLLNMHCWQPIDALLTIQACIVGLIFILSWAGDNDCKHNLFTKNQLFGVRRWTGKQVGVRRWTGKQVKETSVDHSYSGWQKIATRCRTMSSWLQAQETQSDNYLEGNGNLCDNWAGNEYEADSKVASPINNVSY